MLLHRVLTLEQIVSDTKLFGENRNYDEVNCYNINQNTVIHYTYMQWFTFKDEVDNVQVQIREQAQAQGQMRR